MIELVVAEKSDLLHGQMSFEQRAREIAEDKRQEEKEKKELKKSPFRRFFQVNKKNSRYLRSCLDENPTALKLLLFLCEHMDHYNAVVCSHVVLSENLKVSIRTVARATKYLKEHGFVYVYKSGSSNVYVLNNDLVWNSWGTNIQYCEFPANVVLSADEQDEIQTKKQKLTVMKLDSKK